MNDMMTLTNVMLLYYLVKRRRELRQSRHDDDSSSDSSEFDEFDEENETIKPTRKRQAEEVQNGIENKIRKTNPCSTSENLSTNIKTEQDDCVDPLANTSSVNDPLEPLLGGNRITSPRYYFQELKKLAAHNQKRGCTFLHLNIISEELNGLNSKLVVRCENCLKDFTVPLIDPSVQKNNDLNKNIISKDIDDSLGHAGLKIIFDSVDVPIMNEGKYKEMLERNNMIENQVFIKEEPFDIKHDVDEY